MFIHKPNTDLFLVQKRSQNKGYCPGWYDLCFGGAMGPEDYFGVKGVTREKALEIVEEKDLWVNN